MIAAALPTAVIVASVGLVLLRLIVFICWQDRRLSLARGPDGYDLAPGNRQPGPDTS